MPSLKMEEKIERRTRRMVKTCQQVLPKEKLDTQREVILLVSIVTKKAIHRTNVGEGLMLDAIHAINLGMKLSFVRTMVSNKKQRLRLLMVNRKINSLLLHVFKQIIERVLVD